MRLTFTGNIYGDALADVEIKPHILGMFEDL